MAQAGRPAGGDAEDPFAVLGVAANSDEAAIRQAYREALRAHPPERDPAGFKRIRVAYEALRDAGERLRGLLFRRLWLDGLCPPTPEELGAGAPQPPAAERLVAELRRLAVAGTDLERTAFPEDMRAPQPPPWARG